jgi:hypothetical protein
MMAQLKHLLRVKTGILSVSLLLLLLTVANVSTTTVAITAASVAVYDSNLFLLLLRLYPQQWYYR